MSEPADALRQDFVEHAEDAAEHHDEATVVQAMRAAARELAQDGWQPEPGEWIVRDEPELIADGGVPDDSEIPTRFEREEPIELERIDLGEDWPCRSDGGEVVDESTRTIEACDCEESADGDDDGPTDPNAIYDGFETPYGGGR